jgi:hypothetical protein
MAQTTSEVWNSRWTATMDADKPEVFDNFFEPYNLVDHHRTRGLQMVDGGGKRIKCNLQSSGQTAEAFSGWDSLNKTPADPYEAAFYNRRYYAAAAALDDTTEWENSGEEEVFDLLQGMRDTAMDSILKAINEDIGGAQAGKTMLGYQNIMADAAGATVGGIDSSASTFWESQRDTTATTFTTSTVTNLFDGITRFNSVMDKVRKQGGRVSTIATTYSIAGAYRVSLASQGYVELRGTDIKGLKGEEFPGYMGARMVPDEDIAALHAYFFDDRSLKLRVMRRANFRFTGFESTQSSGQLGQIGYVVAGVQLTTNNRRRGGVATAITGI